MVRTRCYSHIPRIMPRVYQDNSFNYNSNTVINFGSGFGDYCCPKYNGWNFVADLCSGVLQGIGLAGLYRNFSCGWGGGAGGSKQTSSNNSTNTSSKVEDKDQADLQECEKELGKLEGDPTITDANKDKIKSLYNKVKAGSEGTLKDDIYSLTNQAHYKRMLASLEKLYTFDKDGNPTKKATTGTTGTTGTTSTTGEGITTPTGEGPELADVDTLEGLTEAEKADLKNLGVKVVEPYSGKAKALTLPSDLSNLTKANLEKIAKIAKKHNLKVAVGYNSGINGDKWIAGNIENITENGGKLSYDINCSNYGTLGLKYTATQKDNEYNIMYKSGTVPTRYTAEADGADYQYSSNLLRRNSSTGIVHK